MLKQLLELIKRVVVAVEGKNQEIKVLKEENEMLQGMVVEAENDKVIAEQGKAEAEQAKEEAEAKADLAIAEKEELKAQHEAELVELMDALAALEKAAGLVEEQPQPEEPKEEPQPEEEVVA